MALSLNGFAVDPPRLVSVVAPNGSKASIRDDDDIRLVFEWYLDAYHDNVEPISTVTGFRSAAGNTATGTPVTDSNHRSGTALDVNGAQHPYEYTHRAGWRQSHTPAELQALRAILTSAHGALRHGIDFDSPYRDPMHVEIAPGAAAAVRALAARVRKARTTGSMGVHLRRGLQRALGVVPDGDLGSKSFTALQHAINAANARGKFLRDGPLAVTGRLGTRDRVALVKYLNWLNARHRFLAGGPLSTKRDTTSRRRNIAIGKALNAGLIREDY